MTRRVQALAAITAFLVTTQVGSYELERPKREIVHVFSIGPASSQLNIGKPFETDPYFPNTVAVLPNGMFAIGDMGNWQLKLFSRTFEFLDSVKFGIQQLYVKGNLVVLSTNAVRAYVPIVNNKFGSLTEIRIPDDAGFSRAFIFDGDYLVSPQETGFAWKIEKNKLLQIPEDEWISKSNFGREQNDTLRNAYIGGIRSELEGSYHANEMGSVPLPDDLPTHPKRRDIGLATLSGIDQAGNQHFAYLSTGSENYLAVANSKEGLIKAFDITPLTAKTYNSSPFIAPNGDMYYLETSTTGSTLYRIKNTWDPITMATLNDSQVRVRDAGSTAGIVLTLLNKGDKVAILETSKGKQTVGGKTAPWYKVQLGDWSTGWVFGAFVDIDAVK